MSVKCDLLDRDNEFDVVIIGYGPAGATLANLLGRRGYRVAVVEQSRDIYDKPRAITADQEVMRVFQECGLAETIESYTVPHPGTDFVGLDGLPIKHFYPAPPPHVLAWEPTWMFVQPQLEATLRQGVARFPQVQLYLAHEFLRVTQSQAQVRVEIRRLDDGACVVLKARYAIACDGARSAVRSQFNAPIDDLAFDEWWIVVDAWLRSEVKLPERCVQYCRPSRPGTYIVGPGDLRRWEIKMLPGETPQDFVDAEAIKRVLAEFVDVGGLDLCRTAIYRFHALVVDQWRFGRVFLMGDAAHQMPPFLGQGLCAAIRDAVNLAWKIDAVERTGVHPSLLDSYGQERKPHVRTIVGHAKQFGLIIGELDMDAARLRDARLREALSSGQAQTIRQKFIPGLEAGLIDCDANQQPRAGAGALFVQPWVQCLGQPWVRLDDLVPSGFMLIGAGAEWVDWLDSALRELWGRLQGATVMVLPQAGSSACQEQVWRVVERDGVLATWLKDLGAQVALVRPDHYVYGVANSADELNRLVQGLHARLYRVE